MATSTKPEPTPPVPAKRSPTPQLTLVPRTVASPFIDWDYEDASDAIEEAVERQQIDPTATTEQEKLPAVPGQAYVLPPRRFLNPIQINRLFYQGDHWQNGAGWLGPHPQPTETGYQETMLEIALGFTSKNAIREVVDRHVNGVLARPPQWGFVPRRALADGEQPTPDEATAIAEATELVRQWWNARRLRALLRKATSTLLLSERAPFRLYIPRGLLTTTEDATGKKSTRVVAKDVGEALGMIWPDDPDPEHAAVLEDDDTKQQVGISLYEECDDEDDVDGDHDADEETEDRAALTYIDNGKTVIRTVGEDEESEEESASFDFGGRLAMHEMHRGALITPQIQQAQRCLNLALSMIPRNVVTGGFLERVILNAQMPGTYETDDKGERTGRFIPAPYFVGPGTTNFLTGVQQQDKHGDVSYAAPSVAWREPVTPDAAIAAAAAHYTDILDEAAQLHVLMSKDGQIGWKSREQARADFLDSLGDTAVEVEAAGRFLLETPLAMAEALAGTPGKYTKLVRADFHVRLSSGPLSADERKANDESIGRSLSRETAMVANGVEDVPAEIGRMERDPLSELDKVGKQATAVLAFAQAGATVDGAAKVVGIDPKDAEKLVEGATLLDHPAPTDPNQPPAKGGTGKQPPAPAPKGAKGA